MILTLLDIRKTKKTLTSYTGIVIYYKTYNVHYYKIFKTICFKQNIC